MTDAQAWAKRRWVLVGSTVSMLYTVLLVSFGTGIFNVEAAGAAARIALVLKWMALPGLVLALLVIMVGNARFLVKDIIDGEAPPSGTWADIDRRCLNNTLEQVILAFFGWSALALQLPDADLGVIPLLACSFVFARICFWAGYHHSGPARAFGFGATFLPTLVSYGWALMLWLG
ncbi:MAPEG family protein [Thalassospiraceae bacterium LMO-JJ14]|nr:MAPEG family protein [Thalassospiraceae bacterium LMO-JJ14]